MPIHTLARRPEPLPIAPKSCDTVLLRRLIAQRHELHALAVVLVPRCQFLQQSAVRGRWYSRKDMQTTQRMCRTLLKAAHAHVGLGVETLAALDRVHAFCEGIEISTASEAA